MELKVTMPMGWKFNLLNVKSGYSHSDDLIIFLSIDPITGEFHQYSLIYDYYNECTTKVILT